MEALNFSKILRQAFCISLALTLVVGFSLDAEGKSLQFASRTWNIKKANSPVGPGPNRFSDSANNVWSDADGLHMTIRKKGNNWFSTEVILDESLGYGTYLFQTDTRQDILDPYATFGAFTWDNFGDSPDPGNPFREIDIEDSRWGNPANPFNTQYVVTPFQIPGNIHRFTFPDLSADARLTRFLTWSPEKIEFYTLRGHHTPTNFTPADVIDQYVYLHNGTSNLVPVPGRENFRFNLWLNTGHTVPFSGTDVEVVINDFSFLPLAAPTIPGDFDSDGDVDSDDLLQWQGDVGVNGFSDADEDGDSDGFDFLIWQQNITGPAPVSSQATPVPEPSSLLLSSAAFLLMLLFSKQEVHDVQS